MSALVSVSVPRNIPIETSSSRCHLEIKARSVVFVVPVCGLKHQNMPSAILYSFSYGGHFFTAVSFMICQCLESWFVFRQAILMEAQVSLGFPYEDRLWSIHLGCDVVWCAGCEMTSCWLCHHSSLSSGHTIQTLPTWDTVMMAHVQLFFISILHIYSLFLWLFVESLLRI